MLVKVQFSRTDPATPLLIQRGNTFQVADDGFVRPDTTWRRSYADESAFTPGSLMTHAVPAQGNQLVPVLIHHTTRAGLMAAMDELEAAVSQFTYEGVFTTDTTSYTRRCDPADVSWTHTKAMWAALYARAAVVVPVFPVAMGA